MTKRLHVLLDESEFERLRGVARGERIEVGEWVRRAIRRALEEAEATPMDKKILAIREAARHSYPTGDIEQINAEIEEGYQSGLP